MSQPVQQVTQMVSGTQLVNCTGQVVMTTTSGLTTISGQQLMAQLVNAQGNTFGTNVVTSAMSLASGMATTQVLSGQTVSGMHQVIQGQHMIPSQQIQLVNHQASLPSPVALAPQKPIIVNQSVSAPSPSNISADTTAPVVSKQRVSELIREVDSSEQLDDDVEEMLMTIADDFIESTVNGACRLAKHRGSRTLDVKDVQMYLERNWHMWIPGFGTDELRPYKRAPTTEAHRQRLAVIRKAIKKY